MKKLLASDLDGTLVNYGKVSEIDKQSILKLREQNHFFGVSTGRPYNGVSFLKEEYKIDLDFYVLLNGAFILDRNLNVLKHDRIPFKVVNEIFERYKECKLLGIDEGYETTILVGNSDYSWGNTYFRNIDEVRGHECSLISIDFSNRGIDEILRIYDEINRDFSDYVVAYRNFKYVDVVPKGCSKGLGVKTIADKLGVNLNDVYVIGDSFNDAAMFEITKNSFTFPRVEENLKEKANFIVDSVSQCIEQYILK